MAPTSNSAPNAGVTLAQIRAGKASLRMDTRTTSAAVREVQGLLRKKGHPCVADGIFGRETTTAVVDFQAAQDLVVDGICGVKTLAALETTGSASAPITPSEAVLRRGAKGAEATALQKALKAKGYKVAVDGAFGYETAFALETFQLYNNLPRTRELDAATRLLLMGDGIKQNKPKAANAGADANADHLLAIAEAELGNVELGENNTIYGYWYGVQTEWCAMFVSWCANEAGIVDEGKGRLAAEKIPKHSGTWLGAARYEDSNRFFKPGEYAPKKGDVVYFYRSAKGRIGHIGIVEAYDEATNTVYTIEGNTGNAVHRRHYPNVLYKNKQNGIAGYGCNGGSSLGIVPGGSTSGEGKSTV